MTQYTKPEGSYISYMSNMVKSKGGLNLAQGIPGYEPPLPLLDELKKLTHTSIHQYAPGNGNLELTDCILNKYAQEQKLSADNLLITQGGTEALSLLFIYLKKRINKPFSALAFRPVYESYRNLPEIFQTPFVEYAPLENGEIDFNNLTKTIKQQQVKVIFLATPGNPLGKIWSKKEIEMLINICEQQEAYLILDAVYRELYFDHKPFITPNYTHANILYTNSFSKLFSITGWRIGYILANKTHMKNIKAIHDYTGLCAPSLQQQALANYLKKHNMGNDYVEWLRATLTKSFHKLSTALQNLHFTMPAVGGGYFVWAQLPKPYTDGFSFAMDLYNQQQVAVIPGEHFAQACQNYVRFNIARPITEIDEAIVRLSNFMEK